MRMQFKALFRLDGSSSSRYEKTLTFREIYISAEIPDFVISNENLSSCSVNEEIFKNIINIHSDSQCPSSQ